MLPDGKENGDASSYCQLDGERPRLNVDWGFGRRLLTVCCAVAACFLNAGLVFGYSAIFPALVRDGAFHGECEPGSSRLHVCDRQSLALSGMFTLATCGLNVATFVTGSILDRLGPSLTCAGSAFCVALGCLVFSLGNEDEQDAYTWGYLLMAIGGPAVFMSTVSFANLFQGREGLVTAAVVGSFDASSAVFLGLEYAMDSGVSFSTTFQGFALAPIGVSVVALLLWPGTPIAQVADEGDGNDCGSGVVAETLQTLPLRRQIMSAEFWLVVHALSVCMVCVNFYIATVDEQVTSVDPDNGPRLAQAFATMLPLGGIVWIPLCGAVADRLSIPQAWSVLWACLLVFLFLNAVHSWTANVGVACSAFLVFSFCRPLLYTLAAGYVGTVFGFQNFGKIYGLLFTLAGIANGAVQAFRSLAQWRDFGTANLVLFAVQFTAIILPWVSVLRERRKPRCPTLLNSPATPVFTPQMRRMSAMGPAESKSPSAER